MPNSDTLRSVNAGAPFNFNVQIVGHAESDGARWLLESYADYGPLARARNHAKARKGVYEIFLNDQNWTLVRKNF
jgi:hypothetical protein